MNEPARETSVLLVDDEDEFLEVTSTVLGRRGFKVFTALSGAMALEFLQRRRVDVVVLDMKMPVMSGAEAFERIKQAIPGIPVIVLTGHGSVDQAFTMSKEGVYDFLQKPCNIDSLTAVIRAAAAESKARKSLLVEKIDEPPGAEECVRVLLVDDEVELLDSLKRVLSRRNMEVHWADRGEEALTILERMRVDVVVLDVKMPGMDGLEVLDHIRNSHSNLPVILLTGHPTVENALAGMKKGAFEYLMKPPDIDSLVRSIRKAFQDRQRRIEEEREKALGDILRKYPD